MRAPGCYNLKDSTLARIHGDEDIVYVRYLQAAFLTTLGFTTLSIVICPPPLLAAAFIAVASPIF